MYKRQEYAQGSPYYKSYFERQWEIYAKSREKVKKLEKNISYRNALICADLLLVLLAFIYSIDVYKRQILMRYVARSFIICDDGGNRERNHEQPFYRYE